MMLMLNTIGAAIPGENPQPGVWKVSLRKGAPKVLMQIWLADAETFAAVTEWRAGLTLAGQIGGTPADNQDIVDRWLYAEPATKDEAAHWRQHGRWPADPPPITRTHNLPADPFEALKVEIEERIEQAERLLTQPIANQLACDTAVNHQRELAALLKRADAMHEVEKRPHLEAGSAVDAKFRFRETLASWAAKLRTAYKGWMFAEEHRLQEAADAKHRDELARVETERQRIEAEYAKKLADDPVSALTDPAPELPLPPPAPEVVRVQAGGGVGRKAGLRDDWDFRFTEYKLAALHVVEDPGVAIEVGKAIKRRIRAAKGRIDIPGVEIIPKRSVA